jgi:hypothetical protein
MLETIRIEGEWQTFVEPEHPDLGGRVCWAMTLHHVIGDERELSSSLEMQSAVFLRERNEHRTVLRSMVTTSSEKYAPPHLSDEESEPELSPETVVKSRRRTFASPELAFEQMSDYGFRFCYPDQLVDSEGLMRHFSEKISIGYCCLNYGR